MADLYRNSFHRYVEDNLSQLPKSIRIISMLRDYLQMVFDARNFSLTTMFEKVNSKIGKGSFISKTN